MSLISLFTLISSLVLLAQSLYALSLMLYTWENPERMGASQAPASYLAPHYSFTVLLPARHEEAVMYGTIQRVWAAHYPRQLLEVVVICHADDLGTIAEAQRAIAAIGSPRIRVETFSDPPINKPHGLNVGLQCSSHQVVTIFDAEDDIDPYIFNMVNTVMLKEGIGVVQGGVQLMNFKNHWFGIYNCLEYYFWFKSGLQFYSRLGVIPLGGNTIFIRRDLLTRIGGWDQYCLTEDAEIGLRLSVLGEPIRVIYDPQHVTREETPDSTAAFIKQRTRWHQGFLQVLRKGTWRSLPHKRQRILAFITLFYPLFQAAVILLWPVNILEAFWVKEQIIVSLLSFLPLYALIFQFMALALGAVLFTKEYGFRFPLWRRVQMLFTFLPFQWLLGISAVRSLYRELRRQQNWEKTAHIGAHREQASTLTPVPPIPVHF